MSFTSAMGAALSRLGNIELGILGAPPPMDPSFLFGPFTRRLILPSPVRVPFELPQLPPVLMAGFTPPITPRFNPQKGTPLIPKLFQSDDIQRLRKSLDTLSEMTNSLLAQGYIQRQSVNPLIWKLNTDVLTNPTTTHLVGNSGVPAVSTGPGAGPNATATIVGSDLAGTITLTTSVADTPIVAATIVALTFSIAYTAPPIVLMMPANDAAWNLTYGTAVLRQVDVTGTAFTIRSGSSATLPATTAAVYVWNYMVMGIAALDGLYADDNMTFLLGDDNATYLTAG
jgi:hypothetical protein